MHRPIAALVLVVLAVTSSRDGALAAPSSPIDGSTIRVFAVGTVGTEQLEAPNNTTVGVARSKAGHGSGFVVDERLVLTAAHVVEDARHVVVRLPGDGGFFPARVVYADKTKDVALLAVDGTLPPALALTPEPPRVRSTVFAVGYPIDATRKQPQSARGIIAGFLDDGTVQVDMALNPGNSGGPIVNEQEMVVGMAIARGAVEEGVQGIGYAVPVQMLQAALVEAKRRLSTGEAAGATGMSRDSATVVDELVQHGALYELRKTTELATTSVADLDKALAEVIARIRDADLLVFVASAMWNVSIALEYAEPTAIKLTREQALSLSARLRQSAVAAVQRAIHLDSSVGVRSSFVGLAAGRVDDAVTAPGTTAASAVPIRSSEYHVLLQAAPLARFNETTGSQGIGVGGSVTMTFGRREQAVVPLIGVALGNVNVSTDDGKFSHTLFAAQAGVVARYDDVYVSAALEACLYSISIVSVTSGSMSGSASDVALSFRLSAGYRIGIFEIGTAARFLGGPTVWLEPVYAALAF